MSCYQTNQQKQNEIYYIIKHYTQTQNDTSYKDAPPPPPPPPAIFYCNHNFILVDTSRIFYHNKHIFYSCRYNLEENKPPRIFLTPDSIIEINPNELLDFLTTIIPDSIAVNEKIFAAISSPKDTIYNRSFKIIRDYFKSMGLRRHLIRNWTEEEQYVVTAKIEKKQYDANMIDWKVGFVDPLDTVLSPPSTR